MAIKIGKILGKLAEVLPLGSTAKSLIKGAGSLLFKKAAKAVGIKEDVVDNIFVEANKIAEYDQEIKMALIEEEKQRRAHELALFGRFAELDSGSQRLRARIRPLLSFGLVGLFVVYGITSLVQQLFPLVPGFEFAIVFPPELVTIIKWVVGFWFGGRSLEKIIDTVRNGKS